MGFDKLRAEVDGAPMLARVVRALDGVCKEVVVVGDGGPELPGVRRVSDVRSGYEGPLAGFEAGLAATRERFLILCAGDMPFVSVELAGALIQHLRNGARAVVPEYPAGRLHPLFAAYGRGVEREVGAALGSGVRSMRGMLDLIAGGGEPGGVRYVREGIDRPELSLMNVNSPGDLALARKSLA